MRVERVTNSEDCKQVRVYPYDGNLGSYILVAKHLSIINTNSQVITGEELGNFGKACLLAKQISEEFQKDDFSIFDRMRNGFVYIGIVPSF